MLKDGGAQLAYEEDGDDVPSASGRTTALEDRVEEAGAEVIVGATSRNAYLKAEYERWWKPVTEMRFDDPDQDAPLVKWPNYARTFLPRPHLWLTAYRRDRDCGVLLGGYEEARRAFLLQIGSDLDGLEASLPEGTIIEPASVESAGSISTRRAHASFADDSDKRAWLMAVLNSYANALRPLAKHITTMTPLA